MFGWCIPLGDCDIRLSKAEEAPEGCRECAMLSAVFELGRSRCESHVEFSTLMTEAKSVPKLCRVATRTGSHDGM